MFKGIEIADIHMGIKDTKRVYEEMSFFKDYLDKSNADVLNINGDFFDRKLNLNETASMYALLLFDEIVSICRKNKTKIRVLQGTASHDLNQLNSFSHYLTDPDIDIRFIYTVEDEEIDGHRFLYVPEEYPKNYKEYYSKFMENEYKVIHGHGTWDFVAFDNQIEESENVDINSAPIFIYKDWEKVFKDGVAIFGHIHGRNTYKKKIFYPGSYSRWGYGENSEKGFTEYIIDDDGKVSVEFINNKIAPKYDTYSIENFFDDIPNVKFEELKKQIDILHNLSENVRIDISGVSEDVYKLIKESFKEENTKIIYKTAESKFKELNEAEQKIYNKYDYILKRELPIDETIKRFIIEEYVSEIDIEDIRSMLVE